MNRAFPTIPPAQLFPFLYENQRSSAAVFYKASISQCCGKTRCRFFIEIYAIYFPGKMHHKERIVLREKSASRCSIVFVKQCCRESLPTTVRCMSLNLLLEVPCISTNGYMLSSKSVFDIVPDCLGLFMFEHVLKYTNLMQCALCTPN